MIPMSQRIREAGDQAVPMLQDLIVKAAVHACMAREALNPESGAPDLEEVDRRLGKILRTLLMGED
jgi:hypothetical protein